MGKTVNKLRKHEQSGVQNAAASLLKDWKAVASLPAAAPAAAPAPAAPPPSGLKRTLSSEPPAGDKRPKVGAAYRSLEPTDEHSLDSALSAGMQGDFDEDGD